MSSSSKLTVDGADDRANQTAFHGLRKHGKDTGVPDPDPKTVAAWVRKEQARIADAPETPRLTPAKRADLQRRLGAALDAINEGRDCPDGPTFYAWQNLRDQTIRIVAERDAAQANAPAGPEPPPAGIAPPPVGGATATNCPRCGRWAGQGHACDTPAPQPESTPAPVSSNGTSPATPSQGTEPVDTDAPHLTSLAAAHADYQAALSDRTADFRTAHDTYQAALLKFSEHDRRDPMVALTSTPTGERVTAGDVNDATNRARRARTVAREPSATEQDMTYAQETAARAADTQAAYDSTPEGKLALNRQIRAAGNSPVGEDLRRRAAAATERTRRQAASNDPTGPERERLRAEWQVRRERLRLAQNRLSARRSDENIRNVEQRRREAHAAQARYLRKVPTTGLEGDLNEPGTWTGNPPAGVTRADWWAAGEFRAREADHQRITAGQLTVAEAQQGAKTRALARETATARIGPA